MATAPGGVSYNYSQLQYVWIQANGSPQAAPMAAAIAMAESSGNSHATNNDGSSVDRGLWQINSVHGSQSSYDVMTNARAAVAISGNGTNWRPWCTAWSDGACGSRGGTYLGPGAPYQKFLGNAGPTPAPINGTNAAAGQPNTTGATATNTSGTTDAYTTGIVSTLGGDIVRAMIGWVLNPFINLIAGVIGMFAGGLLMVFGIWEVVSQTRAGQAVKRTVTSGVGTAVGVAGMATGQPEVALAGSAIGASGAPQRAQPSPATETGYRTTTVRHPVEHTAEGAEVRYVDVFRSPITGNENPTRRQLNAQAYEYQQRGRVRAQ